MTLRTIYVFLLDEGVEVWRTVEADELPNQLFRIVSANPEGEHWQFPSGTVVRCEARRLSHGPALVAVAAEQAVEQ